LHGIRGFRGAAALLVVNWLAGCVPVPVYDSKTDEMLTGLQKDADTFIQHLSDTYDATAVAGKACAYDANVKSYAGFRLSIGLLKTRADALYDDKATQAALKALQDTFDALENAHKAAANRADHCILPDLLVTDQQALDSAVGSLLKLELAKKGTT
jgi:hypothetical protein